ncbi:MAG: 6-bladed beta-propeller, partial [Longimicrobiales bacterium]
MVRFAISFAATLLLAACALDASSRWGGSTETLPNGAVRVSNPAQGLWLESEAWRLVQELKLGSLDGDADVFASISDIEVDRDGRVYVLDRQLNELRIFDRAGGLLRSTGRSGHGPGEFDNAFGLEWLPAGDSLLVVDGRGGRYNIFDKEGNFVRSTLRPLTRRKYTFDGGFTRGLLIENELRRVGDEYQPELIVMRLGAQAELIDTIPFPHGPSPIPPYSVQNPPMSIGVPFSPELSWYLPDDSTFWVGHGDEYRIVQISLRGDTLREILSAADALPVAPEEIAAWMETESTKRFKELGGVLDLGRIPKHKPFFTDLY